MNFKKINNEKIFAIIGILLIIISSLGLYISSNININNNNSKLINAIPDTTATYTINFNNYSFFYPIKNDFFLYIKEYTSSTSDTFILINFTQPSLSITLDTINNCILYETNISYGGVSHSTLNIYNTGNTYYFANITSKTNISNQFIYAEHACSNIAPLTTTTNISFYKTANYNINVSIYNYTQSTIVFNNPTYLFYSGFFYNKIISNGNNNYYDIFTFPYLWLRYTNFLNYSNLSFITANSNNIKYYQIINNTSYGFNYSYLDTTIINSNSSQSSSEIATGLIFTGNNTGINNPFKYDITNTLTGNFISSITNRAIQNNSNIININYVLYSSYPKYLYTNHYNIKLKIGNYISPFTYYINTTKYNYNSTTNHSFNYYFYGNYGHTINFTFRLNVSANYFTNYNFTTNGTIDVFITTISYQYEIISNKNYFNFKLNGIIYSYNNTFEIFNFIKNTSVNIYVYNIIGFNVSYKTNIILINNYIEYINFTQVNITLNIIAINEPYQFLYKLNNNTYNYSTIRSFNLHNKTYNLYVFPIGSFKINYPKQFTLTSNTTIYIIFNTYYIKFISNINSFSVLIITNNSNTNKYNFNSNISIFYMNFNTTYLIEPLNNSLYKLTNYKIYNLYSNSDYIIKLNYSIINYTLTIINSYDKSITFKINGNEYIISPYNTIILKLNEGSYNINFITNNNYYIVSSNHINLNNNTKYFIVLNENTNNWIIDNIANFILLAFLITMLAIVFIVKHIRNNGE